MPKFIIRFISNAVALYAALYILNGRGIETQNDQWVSVLILALIFGLVNAIVKPILVVAGCPVLILTLGLGMLLINTLMFYLAGIIGQAFNAGFTVDGFVPAFLGALIVSVVSFVLNALLRDDKK